MLFMLEKSKNAQIHRQERTVEDVVPRMHLAQLCHVVDWMTTGRGGADAGLTADTDSIQSAEKETNKA